MKPRLRAEELTEMISLLKDKFVRSENLRRCCFVPIRRNSVLDGLVGGWIHSKPVGWLVCLFADRSNGSAHIT